MEINSTELLFDESCKNNETKSDSSCTVNIINTIEDFTNEATIEATVLPNGVVEVVEKPEVHIEHNYSRMDMVITDIENMKNEYLAINNEETSWSWKIKTVKDGKILICSIELSPGKFVTVTLLATLYIKIKVDNKNLESSDELTTNWDTKIISTLRDFLKISYEIEIRKVCEGVDVDPEFDHLNYSLRSSSCDLLVKGRRSKRCKRCTQAQRAIEKRKVRLAKRTSIHKNTPHRYFTIDDLKTHLKSSSIKKINK